MRTCPSAMARSILTGAVSLTTDVAQTRLCLQVLGHQESLAYAPWPTYDPQLLVDDTITLPVQVRRNSTIVNPAMTIFGLDALGGTQAA